LEAQKTGEPWGNPKLPKKRGVTPPRKTFRGPSLKMEKGIKNLGNLKGGIFWWKKPKGSFLSP